MSRLCPGRNGKSQRKEKFLFSHGTTLDMSTSNSLQRDFNIRNQLNVQCKSHESCWLFPWNSGFSMWYVSSINFNFFSTRRSKTYIEIIVIPCLKIVTIYASFNKMFASMSQRATQKRIFYTHFLTIECRSWWTAGTFVCFVFVLSCDILCVVLYALWYFAGGKVPRTELISVKAF